MWKKREPPCSMIPKRRSNFGRMVWAVTDGASGSSSTRLRAIVAGRCSSSGHGRLLLAVVRARGPFCRPRGNNIIEMVNLHNRKRAMGCDILDLHMYRGFSKCCFCPLARCFRACDGSFLDPRFCFSSKRWCSSACRSRASPCSSASCHARVRSSTPLPHLSPSCISVIREFRSSLPRHHLREQGDEEFVG